jgi:hypothetical protein
MGDVQFEPAKRIWGTWAPPRCKFLWLTSLNHCWAADRLARQGLDHPPHCLLCEQEEENIQHILVGCVFSREVWFQMLSWVGTSTLHSRTGQFLGMVASNRAEGAQASPPGFNSLVVLILWCLWKHRNVCVFDEISPTMPRIILDIKSGAWLVLRG